MEGRWWQPELGVSRALCCFRGCIPALCRVLAKVRQLAGSRETLLSESHVRIFKVKDQLLERSKKLLIIERRTLKPWFFWIFVLNPAFFGKKEEWTLLEHRNTDISLVVGESFFSRESHRYLINKLTLLHGFFFCWLTDSWSDLLGRENGIGREKASKQ